MYNNNPYLNPYQNYGYTQQPMYQSMQQNNTLQNSTGSLLNNTNAMQNSRQLQGKIVESVDVVKSLEIPLDGTISYFPLADGSGIVSKQMTMNGTSKITVFKAVSEENEEEKPNIVEELKQSLDELKTSINELKDRNNDDIIDTIEDLRKEIKKKSDK